MLTKKELLTIGNELIKRNSGLRIKYIPDNMRDHYQSNPDILARKASFIQMFIRDVSDEDSLHIIVQTSSGPEDCSLDGYYRFALGFDSEQWLVSKFGRERIYVKVDDDNSEVKELLKYLDIVTEDADHYVILTEKDE